MLVYAAERMVVEGMRTDSLYLGGIRISQLLSAGMLVCAALVFLIRAYQSGRKPVVLSVLLFAFAGLIPFSLKSFPAYLQALHALVLIAISTCLYKNTTRKL